MPMEGHMERVSEALEQMARLLADAGDFTDVDDIPDTASRPDPLKLVRAGEIAALLRRRWQRCADKLAQPPLGDVAEEPPPDPSTRNAHLDRGAIRLSLRSPRDRTGMGGAV